MPIRLIHPMLWLLAALTLAQAAQAAPAPAFARFDTGTTGYSPINAYLTALAAHNTTLDVVGASTPGEFKTLARNRFIGFGLPRVAFVENDRTSTEAIVASNRDLVLITFRGSEVSGADRSYGVSLGRDGKRASATVALPTVLVEPAVKDWILSDANMVQRSGRAWGGNDVRVHSGFARALESVLIPLQAELRKRAVGAGPGSRKPIFVTGHSLGGALATLAAYRLQRGGYPVRAVYLHAAPKVGDAAFSAEYASRRIPTFRTEHWRDIVPTLPSAPLTGAANRALLASSPVTKAVAGRSYSSDNAQRGYVPVASVLKYLSRSGRIFTNPSPRTVERDRGGRLTFADHPNLLYALKLYNALSRRERAGLPAPR